jgi:hypothetical protein
MLLLAQTLLPTSNFKKASLMSEISDLEALNFLGLSKRRKASGLDARVSSIINGIATQGKVSQRRALLSKNEKSLFAKAIISEKRGDVPLLMLMVSGDSLPGGMPFVPSRKCRLLCSPVERTVCERFGWISLNARKN